MIRIVNHFNMLNHNKINSLKKSKSPGKFLYINRLISQIGFTKVYSELSMLRVFCPDLLNPFY